MIAVYTRILLRIFAGILIGWGLPNDWAYELTRDPEVIATAEVLLGGGILAATETAYAMARRFGWQT